MTPRPPIASPWRAQADDAGAFDELCVSDWFHLERMSTGVFWLRVGSAGFWVTVTGRGKGRRVEMRSVEA